MDNRLKILMIEDSESDAGLITIALKKANLVFEDLRVDCKEDFIEALNTFEPDMILSDHSLPQFNSLEAYSIFKQKNLKIPFILITGSVSEEFAVTCLHEGIDDYILKDNLTRLSTAIKNAFTKKELEAKKRELEAKQLAITEKLRQQNEELAKANKELDRFVYSASHELRGPITSVLGLIELTTTEFNERKFDYFEKYLQMMGVSIGKLNMIVEEIVNYSINNRTQIRRELINFDEVINKVLDKLSYLPNINQMERIINIEQACPWYGDRGRLVTILDNLISNSIQYYNRDITNPFVNIYVKVMPDAITIRIEDNGIGIEEKYLDKIFDMFYRVSSLSQGSGLGLYIVKETLEKLGGDINVVSEPDKGTKITVSLRNSL